ncbi:MAG: hypothetical protein ACFN1I_07030 [Selenomonas artemidis]|jgi:hypothetical protein
MMSRSVKIKISCFVLLGVAVLFAGLFWYFRIHTKTPEYTMGAIEQALDRHDENRFLRYVRLDEVLDRGYDDFMAGTIAVDFGQGQETPAGLDDFTKMLKPAFTKMLYDAIEARLTTGEFPAVDQTADGAESENILSRIGLRDLSFREITALNVNEENRTAVAEILAHQGEADADFTFQVALAPSDEGDWQVTGITNLHEYAVFLGKARRAHVEDYLTATGAIIARHDQSVRLAQLRLYSSLAVGTLGNQATRDMARRIMEQDILVDWKQRKEELSAVSVPRSMQSLQQLRLKICDLHIAYAEGYAAWMTDKNAATIRSAESSLRQAEVLEVEESFLVQRAKRSSGDKME